MPALGLGIAPAEAGGEPSNSQAEKEDAKRRPRSLREQKEAEEKKEKLKNLLPPPREFQIPPLEKDKKGPGSTLSEPTPPILGGN